MPNNEFWFNTTRQRLYGNKTAYMENQTSIAKTSILLDDNAPLQQSHYFIGINYNTIIVLWNNIYIDLYIILLYR